MELPLLRQEHGFHRTKCGCAFCTVYCRHMPGTLDPADLPRLCPAGSDMFLWAEHHLRARIDHPYPILVPACNDSGHCHWYFDGRCAVHENAPYSCAFFDSHMSDKEVERRVTATIQACREDATANGLYYRVWLHLRARGLIGRRGDRAAMMAEVQRIIRKSDSNRRKMTR